MSYKSDGNQGVDYATRFIIRVYATTVTAFGKRERGAVDQQRTRLNLANEDKTVS